MSIQDFMASFLLSTIGGRRTLPPLHDFMDGGEGHAMLVVINASRSMPRHDANPSLDLSFASPATDLIPGVSQLTERMLMSLGV